MRPRIVSYIIGLCVGIVALVSVGLAGGDSVLTAAIEPLESSFRRLVGKTTVVLVTTFVGLALASSITRRAGRGRRLKDLFVKVRYAQSGVVDEKSRSGYLRSLSPHRATMIVKEPLASGATVTLSVPAGPASAEKRFRGRVIRCRPSAGKGGWYAARLAVPHETLDEDAVRQELSFLAQTSTVST